MARSGHAKPGEYTPLELMAVCASRAIRDGEVVFVGTGLPMIAALLAKRTHAPRAKILYEAGFIDSGAIDLALSIADTRLGYRAAAMLSLIEALGCALQGGRVDVGFVGAAQIDEYGNINTTWIGPLVEEPVEGAPEGFPSVRLRFDLERVKAGERLIRLPGSGGGNDIISSAKRIVVVMRHDKRKFVKKLTYMTSPGHLNGPGARKKAGLLGGGPELVITNMCLMDFDEQTKRIRLKSVHPGFTVDDILDNVSFDLIVPEHVPETEPPTYEELRILREIDKEGLYLGRR